MNGKRTYEPDWKGGSAPGATKAKPVKETKQEKRARTGKGRIVDPDALKRKLASDQTCRATGKRATDPHHILLKSQQGDDLEDNILPLAHEPHDIYHDTGVLPGVTLTAAERAYLVSKLGEPGAADYIRRKFPPKEAK